MAICGHANVMLRKDFFRVRSVDAFLEHRDLHVPSPKNPPGSAHQARIQVLKLSLRHERLKASLSQFPPVDILIGADERIGHYWLARFGECVQFLEFSQLLQGGEYGLKQSDRQKNPDNRGT